MTNGPIVGYLFARDFRFADGTFKFAHGYGNIGRLAAYGSGAAAPTHYLGFVPAGHRMDLRYVIRSRQWVMAKWYSGSLAAGIEWAFFPRSLRPVK